MATIVMRANTDCHTSKSPLQCCKRGRSRISEGGANKAFTWKVTTTTKPTQRAEHALSRGVWGHAPHRKILQIWSTEIEFGSENNTTLFIPLLHLSLFI